MGYKLSGLAAPSEGVEDPLLKRKGIKEIIDHFTQQLITYNRPIEIKSKALKIHLNHPGILKPDGPCNAMNLSQIAGTLVWFTI